MAQNPSSPSAVRFFAPDHPALANTLRRKIEVRRTQVLEEFTGRMGPNEDDIRRGRIYMLDEILQLCLDTERELSGEKP